VAQADHGRNHEALSVTAVPELPLVLLELSHGRMTETWTLHYADSAHACHVTVHRSWLQDDGTRKPYDKPTQTFPYRDLPRVAAALQKAARLIATIRCAEVQAETTPGNKTP